MSQAALKFSEPVLSPGKKLVILRFLLAGKSPGNFVVALTPEEIAEAQKFIWDRALEIGITIKGEHFSQSDIIRHMRPVSKFQQDNNCNEPLQKCESNECLFQDLECARIKIKDQIDTMALLISEFLHLPS